ncbi:MAG: murein biosynthesis integral membrane protein MurJ [Armatimonadota bacterium]
MITTAAPTRHRLGALWQAATRGRSSRAVALLAVLSGAGLVLALARQIVTAYYFGTSAELDTFLVAISAPQTVGLAFSSALVSVVVPEYVRLRDCQGMARASQMARRWARLALGLSAGAAVLLAIFPSLVIRALAPGFPLGQIALARTLLVVLAGSVVLYSLSGVSTAVVNANRCFWRPGLQAALISAMVVLSCSLLATRFGIWALAVGTLAGLGCAFALQAAQKDFRIVTRARGPSDVGRPSLAPLGLALGTAGAAGLYQPVDRWFGSRFAAGTISQLNYATSLLTVPAALLVSPLITVLLPVLSECIAGRDWPRLCRVSLAAAAYCLAVCIPAVLVLACLSSEVVRVVLGRGRFDAAAVAATARFLRILAPMLLMNAFSWGLRHLLVAARRYELLFAGELVTVGTKLVAARALLGPMGSAGLPASSVVASVAAVFVFGGLSRKALQSVRAAGPTQEAR